MQGKMTVAKSIVVLLVLCLAVPTVQASPSDYDNTTSLLNPWSASNFAVEKVAERTFAASDRLTHAAFDGFDGWTAFADYDFGNNNDKRAGGFGNYFNSYTLGADAFYGRTLWGLMGNFNESKGRSGTTINSTDTWSFTLYMGQSINEWAFWGSSFTYSNAETGTRGQAGDVKTDSYSVAPYVSFMHRVDNWTFALSPTYMLGCQRVKFPLGGGKDSGHVGRAILPVRASYAIDAQWSISGNLAYNQVLHSDVMGSELGLPTADQWFTTGAKVNYQATESLGLSLGYSSELESNFNSEIWSVGLSYAF